FKEAALNTAKKSASYLEKSTAFLSIPWCCYPSLSGYDDRTSRIKKTVKIICAARRRNGERAAFFCGRTFFKNL
ncbi:MAG: hypothetical protein LBO64_09950, partial [Desulfovibrio sp.]|nr:hypothetical protein [Desulfovibrio sp.]